MSPVLLLPGALAALAALIVPLVLHLARRSEPRPTDFAALRWLREKARPRSRIRFDEKLLLAARLILLALLALWLAEPALRGGASDRAWAVAAPGIDPAAARAALPPGARLRWLAPGFPDADEAPSAGAAPFDSLLRELDATMPAGVRLTMFVPAMLNGADAERPRLSRPVEWRVLSGTMPGVAVAPLATPRVAIRYAPGAAEGLPYVKAAALALRPGALDIAASDSSPVTGTDVVIRLAAAPVGAALLRWAEQGGTLLLDHRTTFPGEGDAIPLWTDAGRTVMEGRAIGRGRVLRFTMPLRPADLPILLDPDFAARLRDVLQEPSPAPTRVMAIDHAPLGGGMPYPQPARDLRPWLALLIGALVLLERLLATRRSRAAAP